MSAYINNNNANFYIMKDGVEICRSYMGYARGMELETTSCAGNIEMEVGEQVYVLAWGNFRGWSYSGFSGFQITAL